MLYLTIMLYMRISGTLSLQTLGKAYILEIVGIYSEITHGKNMLNTNTSITMFTFLSKQFATL